MCIWYVGVSNAQTCGRPQSEEQQSVGSMETAQTQHTNTDTHTHTLAHALIQHKSFNFRSVVAIKKSKATKLHSILQI